MKQLIFRCPGCDNKERFLEEIQTDVVVASRLTIDESGEITYFEDENDGGVIDRYQCSTCGWTVKKDKEPITDSEELFTWLVSRQ